MCFLYTESYQPDKIDVLNATNRFNLCHEFFLPLSSALQTFHGYSLFIQFPFKN